MREYGVCGLRLLGCLTVLAALGAASLLPARPPETLPPQPPASMPALAWQDLSTRVRPEERPYTRYLDLGDLLTLEARTDWYLVLSGHLHHLSRSRVIQRPATVPGTAGALLRLNTLHYGELFGKVWERLAEVDPHYHRVVPVASTTAWPGPGNFPSRLRGTVTEYLAADGKWYAARPAGAAGTKVAFAPQVASKELELLAKATQSQVPIVRGRWFFWQTAIQENRAPAGYYDFHGIKTVADYERVIGFDRKVFQGFSIEVRSAVARSGVTRFPRAIAHQEAAGGGYWFSIDFLFPKDARHPLKILGPDIEKDADGFELFGFLPNRFLLTAAANKEKKLVDVVPAVLAGDKASVTTDVNIHPNVGCLRCHQESGFRPITDWWRNLARSPLQIEVLTYDPLTGKKFGVKEIQALREQYATSLEPLLEDDRQRFNRAVQEAVGLEAPEYLKKYAAAWEQLETLSVGLEFAETDTGVPRDTILKALSTAILNRQGDTILTDLTLGDRAQGIPYLEWVQVYPVLLDQVEALKNVESRQPQTKR